MKIGELAQRSGLTASRIRFYESNGLLQTVARQANGYRDYPDEAVTTLAMITSAQNAGFSLDEVRRLLPTGQSGWTPQQLIPALEQKVNDITALEQRLAQNKAQVLALIEGIRNRPEGLDCERNAQRLLEQIREGVVTST